MLEWQATIHACISIYGCYIANPQAKSKPSLYGPTKKKYNH